MDDCLTDLTVEFLAVAFNNILYFTSVYPKSIFESRKKYNVVVYKSVHPQVNQYLDMCLKSIEACLKNNKLKRLEFVITDENYKALLSFIFDFDIQNQHETTDTYFIKSEQNFRAFCLKLSTMFHIFQKLPENTSFTIYLHTNESTAVSLVTNPEVEDFPMIEVENESKKSDGIVPIRSFDVGQYSLSTYVEINELDISYSIL
ncbi:mitotic spindle assembly checkpoint protein MAD2B [Aricia agestis]|uniref:mitotic spindle assembly checkpoint protein MAD2B n=1 Tax=Aricia agestis TaxID=91739 RepID=UPI001C20714F|nr:mitotic spindle assembly checkpoint protein MAD2B [Aricia agestis]